MSSEGVVICADGLSKLYNIYGNPRDRLKQIFLPGFRSILGRHPKRYYREYHALDNISFEIRKGETVGVIGRNGSGKSTLLQILSGTLAPTAGKVMIDGRVAPLLELGAGFNPEFTGRENAQLNARLLGLSEADVKLKFDDIVRFADIGEFIDEPVKTYSSGMFVRLAFAVIAHVDADILVIDEALSVGDAFFVQKCMRFLREFMERGTVVFVSHDTAAVVNLCDRVIWLREGRVEMIGHPKEVTAKYLEDLYEAESSVGLAQVADGDDRDASPVADMPLRDMRQDMMSSGSLRNEIELFEFSKNASGFGVGGATVIDAIFLDQQSCPLSWIVGGEKVKLRIRCNVTTELDRPIVGFEVYDRLGQTIFADNTYLATLDRSVHALPGDVLTAEFDFHMPVMREGEYTMSVAIAEGTQQQHVQHHWLHDALAFHVHIRGLCLGLVGVPMEAINLHVSR